MQVEIELSKLKVAYDMTTALESDDLRVQGKVIAVVGHNGAGKSTLIKSILGLLPLSHGSIRALLREDDRISNLIPEEHMAFCPETGSVFEDISVEDYVRMWCRVKHHNGDYYREAGRKYIDLLALEPLFRKLGRELSKGQRRRVQTAIGFLNSPRLFLFDEPFDGLDVQKTSELTDIIREESRRMAFIISSHRMDVVERLADTIVVLKEGKFVACGSVTDVSLALCRKSVAVSDASNPDILVQILKHEFPLCAVTRIGNYISIAGEYLELAQVERVVRENDRNGVAIIPHTPTLTDAMNFHLKSLK